MKSKERGMQEKVLGAHREAIRITREPSVTAHTVWRCMPGLKRRSHVTRILNSLVDKGLLAISGHQGQRGKFVVTYGMPDRIGGMA
ncbi:hypothetical protein [Komagataeibacter xylinus]|uniref:MarR family transcriptional regulator n=1 Tax=Komagataeibacter xylinus TaxID=28448 RepID=A0A857FM81_KOMXY|nr:hypothetical protein [Komagataeibacter xylinus]QHC35388.1 hypothetical protein FMA36_07610 [Komagataeibacter xylinus]